MSTCLTFDVNEAFYLTVPDVLQQIIHYCYKKVCTYQVRFTDDYDRIRKSGMVYCQIDLFCKFAKYWRHKLSDEF